MIPAEHRRRIEVFLEAPSFESGGRWIVLEDMGGLDEGDRVRMFEPNGDPVVAGDGSTEWTVVGRPSFEVALSPPKMRVAA